MMKHTLAIVLLIVATSSLALGQSKQQASPTEQQTDAQRAAKAELNEAARAYKAGKFVEAQSHSERALKIDPSNRSAPEFIARSIHAQYRRGDEDPENVAIARDAIAAYERLLLINQEDKESFESVVALYEAIGENELRFSWVQQRALNKSLSTSLRVDALVFLASEDRDFAYRVTGVNYDNKQVTRPETGDGVDGYVKPNEREEFDKAQQRATRGLEMIETAIALEPEYEAVWFLKTNVLLTMAKLSEMDGNETRGREYRRLAKESDEHTYELTDRRLQDEDAKRTHGNGVASDTISGGVLNGKAISKPQPPFPAIARTAHAQGTIVVQILVDEEGKVNSASAVSGHPLLRAAAVQAARQARFSPTAVNGQPAKVSGVLFYNFTLP